MNILLTNVGKKTFLVSEFKKNLRSFSYESKLIASDNNLRAQALKNADIKIKSPLFKTKNYLKWIIEVVKKYKIKLIIPTNNFESYYLENIRKKLENKYNCKLLGAPKKILKKTNDKKLLYYFLKKNKFLTPRLFNKKTSKYVLYKNCPLILKERQGQASKNIKLIKSNQQIKKLNFKRKYILQKFIKGDEYGLDIVNNFKRKFVSCLLRKKLLMKNGETVKAKILPNKKIMNFAKKLSKKINHIGLIDVDLIIYKKNIYIIDINCRFGGGYKLSHIAGANIPGYILNSLYNSKKNNKLFFRIKY